MDGVAAGEAPATPSTRGLTPAWDPEVYLRFWTKGSPMLRFLGKWRHRHGTGARAQRGRCVRGSLRLPLVADGVGGAAAGEIASATVAYVVAATALEQVHPRILGRCCGSPPRPPAPTWSLVWHRTSTRRGMATTLSAVVCDGHRVVHRATSATHASTSWRWGRGWYQRVPGPHLGPTAGRQGQDDRGGGSAAPVAERRRPLAGSAAVAGECRFELDVLELDVLEGDRLLLCSDGLTDLVPDARIAEVLGAARTRPWPRPDSPEEALAAGGRDNAHLCGARPGGLGSGWSWATGCCSGRSSTPPTSSTLPPSTSSWIGPLPGVVVGVTRFGFAWWWWVV